MLRGLLIVGANRRRDCGGTRGPSAPATTTAPPPHPRRPRAPASTTPTARRRAPTVWPRSTAGSRVTGLLSIATATASRANCAPEADGYAHRPTAIDRRLDVVRRAVGGSPHAAPPGAAGSSAAQPSTPPARAHPAPRRRRRPPPARRPASGCRYARHRRRTPREIRATTPPGGAPNTRALGSQVWYFRDPQGPNKPDKVTALVRKKDGTNESQDADIEAGQQVHRFVLPTVGPSAVQEVLFVSGSGRCFVIGPDRISASGGAGSPGR